jgi:hypothetical protein
MFFLPSTNKSLNLSDADAFLDSQGGSSNVLKDFLIPPLNMPSDLLAMGISLLELLYLNFSWLFVHLIGQESTFHIPNLALYELYYFRKYVIFN